jgi:GT2 family glycosyltransferase
MKRDWIGVVVLNYNNASATVRCIKSLLNSNYENFKIFLVDNNSSDNSVNAIKDFLYRGGEFIKKIEFLESDYNGGYAYGNNIAIKEIVKDKRYSYIWILNNDTTVEADSMKNLIEAAKQSKADIIGTPLYDKTNKLQVVCGGVNKLTGSTYYIKRWENVPSVCDYIHGASLFMRANVVHKIGLLPQDYFLYYEEVDFCFKAKKAGLKLDIAKNVRVFHEEGATTKVDPNDRIAVMKLTNRILFYKKYFKIHIGMYFGVAISILYKVVTFRTGLALKIIQTLIKRK